MTTPQVGLQTADAIEKNLESKVPDKVPQTTLGMFTLEMPPPDPDEQLELDGEFALSHGERLETIYGLTVAELQDIVTADKDGKLYLGRYEVWEWREARIALVAKLSLLGISNKQIAAQVGVSLSVVHRLKKEVARRAPLQLRHMDFTHFAGDLMFVYKDILQQALLLSSRKEASDRDKVYAMSLALRAQRDLTDFVDRCGGFKNPANAITQSLHKEGVDADGAAELADLAHYLKGAIPKLKHMEGHVLTQEST